MLALFITEIMLLTSEYIVNNTIPMVNILEQSTLTFYTRECIFV